jgi:hypothetical protein
MTKDKIIGTAYVNIIQDEKGEVKFAYGYELDDNAVSLNDLGMLNSFLDKIKDMAKKDFQERLDKNDKEFSIEKDGVEEDEGNQE